MNSVSPHAEVAEPATHPVGTLISVNVGMPKDVAWHGKTVYTGVFKDPVTGPRHVRKLNVDGDGQGDLAGHGGEQRGDRGVLGDGLGDQVHSPGVVEEVRDAEPGAGSG